MSADAKLVKKAEYARHPFSKKKLKVVDVFDIKKDVLCRTCSNKIEKITVVESEDDMTGFYHITVCPSCNQTSWYIIE